MYRFVLLLGKPNKYKRGHTNYKDLSANNDRYCCWLLHFYCFLFHRHILKIKNKISLEISNEYLFFKKLFMANIFSNCSPIQEQLFFFKMIKVTI